MCNNKDELNLRGAGEDLGMAFPSSHVGQQQQQRVFISFENRMRIGFAAHLKMALEREGIMTACQMTASSPNAREYLKQVIMEASVALVILSNEYVESTWCLYELTVIKKCAESHGLVVIPIFYNVSPSSVRNFNGEFGLKFTKLAISAPPDESKNWKEALRFLSLMVGMTVDARSNEAALIEATVEEVRKTLIYRAKDVALPPSARPPTNITTQQQAKPAARPSTNGSTGRRGRPKKNPIGNVGNIQDLFPGNRD